jgi:hypothetical protein
MRRVLSVAAVVAAMAASGTQAWWCTGHMTVVEIAKQKMQQSTEGTNALSAINSVMRKFSTEGPFPKIPSVVEAGCWADDVKGGLDMLTADWHFLNLPYDPTNFPIAHPPAQKETVNVVLTQLDKALRRHPVYWEKSFALANMIHFYGDIHQPLHVTELFSATYPDGDLGGNRIDVTVNGSVSMNLHAVWDSICGYYTVEPNRPLSSSGLAQISALATKFTGMHTGITPAEAAVWNTTEMAQEGYQYAVAYAYENQAVTQSGVSLSSAYISQCYYYATRRIVLAGLRLASELTYLFKDGEEKVTTEQMHARVLHGKEAVLRHAARRHEELSAKHGDAGKRHAKNVKRA